MRDKRAPLGDVVASVRNGTSIALGGNTLHRAPCAFVHELVRQEKRGLAIIKTAASYDVDLLAGAGVIDRAEVAFVGFENVFGLAPRYRRAIESGALRLKEHACYTVISGLRAAAQGVPFMPVAGMFGSDVVEKSGFRTIEDPFTGQPVVAVPAIRPDIAVVHVQEADLEGNARIYGTRFEDVIITQAAQRVIITCERIVDGSLLASRPELTAIPGFLVEAVVEAPRGAWPLSCAEEYDYDYDYLAAYIEAAQDDAAYADFIETHILAPTAAL
ncbi:MAG: CoA-transferase [Anaerolineae bacterium]